LASPVICTDEVAEELEDVEEEEELLEEAAASEDEAPGSLDESTSGAATGPGERSEGREGPGEELEELLSVMITSREKAV
jgi:hypothetical protein